MLESQLESLLNYNNNWGEDNRACETLEYEYVDGLENACVCVR